ncbi:unnamed protein product [Miscanthus lutarioriparius]|uniref:Uncharacterized protein n=1 Tax=Miscanthus lutarioriparius TaxID=422564 RepID=A0A811R8U3_9POAL|nr:unnamed protein product [Miscanthus lutarioriparius]
MWALRCRSGMRALVHRHNRRHDAPGLRCLPNAVPVSDRRARCHRQACNRHRRPSPGTRSPQRPLPWRGHSATDSSISMFVADVEDHRPCDRRTKT